MQLRKILQVSLFQCKYSFLNIITKYDNVAIYFRIILSTIILLSIFGTLFSIWNHHFKIWSNKSTSFKVAQCFDIITNLKQLSGQPNKYPDQRIQVGPSLQFGDGLKAIMMFITVMIHASGFYPNLIFSNINPFINAVCYFFYPSYSNSTQSNTVTSCDSQHKKMLSSSNSTPTN